MVLLNNKISLFIKDKEDNLLKLASLDYLTSKLQLFNFHKDTDVENLQAEYTLNFTFEI